MLQQLIKEATRHLHQELERLMYVQEIRTGTLTFPQYKHMIMTNYLITASYENYLIRHLDAKVALRLEIHKRLKLQALLNDLEEAGIDVPDIRTNLSPITIAAPEQIVGCLYVLEGATLGGQIIFQLLNKNTLLKKHGLHFYFYQVYGEQVISYWTQFCDMLNQEPAAHYPQIINGAMFMYKEFLALARANPTFSH